LLDYLYSTGGLIGLFMASLVGHLTIVFKDVIFVPLLFHMRWQWNPLILGFVGGLGGGIGELGGYFMGRGIGRLTGKESEEKVPKLIEKLGLIGVLISALTPLPDAPLLLVAGSLRLPIILILAVEILGKTILYSLTALAGRTLDPLLLKFFPYPWDSVFILLVSIVFTVIVSWRRSRNAVFSLILKMYERIRKLL